MKPRRVLQVTRIHFGGVAVVVDNLVRNLDKSRYEPIVLFDTVKESAITTGLRESSIKTIDLKPLRSIPVSGSSTPVKKRDNAVWLQRRLGGVAAKTYLYGKGLYEFIRQIPIVRLYTRVIRQNRIDLVHTHSDLRRGKPEIVAAKLTGIPCVTHRHGY